MYKNNLINCKDCNKEISINAKFCPNCGCLYHKNKDKIIKITSLIKEKLKFFYKKNNIDVIKKTLLLFFVIFLLLTASFLQREELKKNLIFSKHIEKIKSSDYKKIIINKNSYRYDEEDINYDIGGKLIGTKYEPYADSFIGKVYNDAQFNNIATKIDRELELREGLIYSGFMGWVGSVIGSILDPVTFVVIFIFSFLFLLLEVKKEIYIIIPITILGAIISETILSEIQIIRIWGESVFLKLTASFIHSLISIYLLKKYLIDLINP